MSTLTGMRILAADDNPMSRMILEAALARTGATLTLVEGGRAALTAWRRGAFHVGLLDRDMPDLSGPDVARTIRAEERQRGGAPTPLIAVTAHVMVQHIEEYKAAGMNGVIGVPYNLSAIGGTVKAMTDAAALAPDSWLVAI